VIRIPAVIGLFKLAPFTLTFEMNHSDN